MKLLIEIKNISKETLKDVLKDLELLIDKHKIHDCYWSCEGKKINLKWR